MRLRLSMTFVRFYMALATDNDVNFVHKNAFPTSWVHVQAGYCTVVVAMWSVLLDTGMLPKKY
jgi:hypothetical protein